MTGSTQPTLMYLVKQLEMAIRAQLDAIVHTAGLTVNQYTALTVLERHSDMTSAQLARHSFVAAQSMAELVSPLLAREFIERRQDPNDRRRLVLQLTPAGRRILRRFAPRVAQLERHMVTALTDPQVVELKELLAACHRTLA